MDEDPDEGRKVSDVRPVQSILARELTAEEIDQVGGAQTCTNPYCVTPSGFPPICYCSDWSI